MTDIVSKLEQKARQIRQSVLEMCVKAETGHVNSSFSCAEILVALYHGCILRYRAEEPAWDGRDRFVLSKGQASPILYAVLADLGFFPREELDRFCAADGKFGVHLQKDVPGVEVTSGSLGIGFGIAAGMALAAQKRRELHMTVALLGDGECYEGAIWETAMFAAHNRLNNLAAIVDRNHLCVTDFTENIVRLEPLDEKWRAFGWNVQTIEGHSIAEILEAFEGWRSRKHAEPTVIIADTQKGRGVSFLSDVPLWHGIAPSGALADQARYELCNA